MPCDSAAFSPDGKRIVTASGDKTARIWDADSGKPIGEPLKGHEDAVVSAAFSPDGKRIVTASRDKTARIWDADSGKPIGEPLKGHEDAVVSAAFSPDGKRIVTASADKTARIWDVFPTPRRWCQPPRPPSRAASRPRSAKPSSCLPSRRPGASRWRSGLTTRPNGSNGSPTSAPARTRRCPPRSSLLMPVAVKRGRSQAGAAGPLSKRSPHSQRNPMLCVGLHRPNAGEQAELHRPSIVYARQRCSPRRRTSSRPETSGSPRRSKRWCSPGSSASCRAPV